MSDSVIRAPNRNLLWARVFVDELARAGLRQVVIAPGSRSTPLVFAFAECSGIEVISLLDERGAAFFALGLAQAADHPVAILCTSGTAAANFLPAVVEARYGRIPLLVLTADRSHELRESGANQTVDQVRLFGTHALWSVDVALPEAKPPAVLLRSLRSLAARAFSRANGAPKGAAHLNFPFRKPLEPTAEPDVLEEAPGGPEAGGPSVRVWPVPPGVSPDQVARLADVINQAQRLAILCGPRSPGDDFPAAVRVLADQSGAALFADALSGVRFGGESLAGYDTYLSAAGRPEPPDAVIQFGAPPTSQALADYAASCRGPHVLITVDDQWQDPDHLATDWIQADAGQLCRAAAEQIVPRPASDWLQAHRQASESALQAARDVRVAQFFDGGALAAAIESLPDGAQVFASSSLSVRNLDQFGVLARSLRVIGNRGASGIDGNVSSAFGLAAANPSAPTLLLIGDLALYHDLNGLIAAQRLGLKLIILCVNNNGGGIFHRLPVAQFDPPFEALFVTPHGMTFEHAAAQFGLRYARAASEAEVQRAMTAALQDSESWLIEAVTDAQADLAARRRVLARAAEDIQKTNGEQGD